MLHVHVQSKVGKYEAEVRQEAQLVRQVAEASVTMAEALSSAGQARVLPAASRKRAPDPPTIAPARTRTASWLRTKQSRLGHCNAKLRCSHWRPSSSR